MYYKADIRKRFDVGKYLKFAIKRKLHIAETLNM